MDEQVNPLERDHFLSVVLPGGLEKNTTVHGSKPVMDLLVTLCASYHLNPSDYTVEFLSPNKNNISFKPNSPIGSLEAEKIMLKPKGVEEKIRRPYMPEASVRLLINYNKSHKAVVRVSPRVPLEILLPVVCDKCEFQVESTILLRDSQGTELLDLTKSLNEHGLREVFAKDTAESADRQHTPEAAATPTRVISPPPLQELLKQERKEKKKSGFLSLFRRVKKKPEMEQALTPPASPGVDRQAGEGLNGRHSSSPDTLPADMPKKRRAPLPPLGASQSVPNNLSSCHLRGPQGSADSTLRSTKRRAPPPPSANTQQQLQVDAEVKVTVDSLNTVEELRENSGCDSLPSSLPSSSSSSPYPSSSTYRPSLTHLHEIRSDLPSFRGKDFFDARCALAKVLTSSVSRGTLVRRLRNSATLPKLYNSSSFMPTTQRSPESGVFSAKPEPVIRYSLPTEPEWEDPAQRKGMTTFKVVPSRKQKSPEPEPTVDVPDHTAVDDNPESEIESCPQIETEEDPCSPDPPPQSPDPSTQETEASGGPPSPSPALELDSQDDPGSAVSEWEDMLEKVEDEAEIQSEVIPAAASPSSDEETAGDRPVTSEDQSESPPSSSRQSLSTDRDCSASSADEREEEQEVVEEEDDDHFPPPPSPVFFTEDAEREDDAASSQPPSPTCNDQSDAIRNEPTSTSPAQSPKPPAKMSTAPSRFAQAVALAVQRSRLQRQAKALDSQAPSGPQSALPSPPRSIYQFGA
ncbi:uncharacterized protein V6R79_007693 [Siganus canaliculatus]